jgi:hypothetical protein
VVCAVTGVSEGLAELGHKVGVRVVIVGERVGVTVTGARVGAEVTIVGLELVGLDEGLVV